MGVYDYAFPAVDRTAVQQITSTTVPSSVIQKINNDETSNLFNSLNSAAANSQQALTYGMYLSRNKTISDIAVDMTEQNKRQNTGARDTYTRQAEINEWQAQNKLDTFFFLQCSFLYLAFIVILLFLRQYGIMPNAALYIVIGVLTVILVGILWNRASYTAYSRDKRYWNRRFIGLDDAGSGLSAKLQCGT
jgi:Flp pilus assembly protein TadB